MSKGNEMRTHFMEREIWGRGTFLGYVGLQQREDHPHFPTRQSDVATYHLNRE